MHYLIGFCAEYNVQGGVLQEHFDLDCNDVKPNCPYRYKSTEAYLCKIVYTEDCTNYVLLFSFDPD